MTTMDHRARRRRTGTAVLLAFPALLAQPSALPSVSPLSPGRVGARDGGDETSTRPPNVVLLVADDLGYGDLGCYGQSRIPTPNLDRLAAEGRRYTDFYAGSTVCAPSRAVLMTGLHTGHATIRGNGKANLRPEDVTLAEVLRAQGYTSALFGKWGLGHEGSSGVPTRQGFDAFFGYLDQHHAHNYYPTFLIRGEVRVPQPNVVPRPGRYGQGVASERKAYSHDLVTSEALRFLDEPTAPFFLCVTWTLPHANNEAGRDGMEVPELGPFADEDWPAPERGFAAMVARLDRDVGRLRAKLDERGLTGDTLVLFTSDNGPHAEGGHDADFFDSNGPLRGIKRSLHEGGVRVPLLAAWPGHVPAGTTSERVAGFWDLMPTLAELAGDRAQAALPERLDGRSFAASLQGDDEANGDSSDAYFAFYEGGGGRSLRVGRWKLLEQPIGSPARLYDLERDPGEETDLAELEPELVRAWIQRMDAHHEESETWRFSRR